MTKFKKLAIPYFVWIFILIIIPLFLMLIFSLSNVEGFSPYTFNFKDFSLSFSQYQTVFSWTFFQVLFRSLGYSLLATLFTFLIGYPVAYFISRIQNRAKYLLLLLFILPMWTNLLLRVQTINNLFKPNSFLTNVFGITINLMDYKSLKIIIVMTIVYLPFMIFPIYTVLEKQDKALLEASKDLGAGPVKTFFKITFPMSLKGVFSGFTMVFLPAAMGFTIPAIVTDGDPAYSMIGQLIERQFMSSSPQYNVGSLMSLIIIIIIFMSLILIGKIDEKGETLL